MNFRVNERVRIKKLKREGIIVDGPQNGEKYLVAIGSMQFWVKSDGLEAIKPGARCKKSNTVQAHVLTRNTKTSIDLHGLTVNIAEDRVLEFISQSVLSGRKEIRIIHGIGSGKVKSAVHKLLSKTQAVSHYMLAPNNPGTTIVYL